MDKKRDRGPLPWDNALWDASDVATYLKVSRSWVYHHAEAGLLPHLRVGALLRFDPAVVRAFAHGGPVAKAPAPKPAPEASVTRGEP